MDGNLSSIDDKEKIRRARDLFPCGLMQPEGHFRFSVDSLLLACFADVRKNDLVADLGCGCGVIGLGMLLLREECGISVQGMDISPEMAAACRINAQASGFEKELQAMQTDLAEIRTGPFRPESFDMIVFNPPYREPCSGRMSPLADRNPALFETRGGLETFCKAARYLLKNRGRLSFVYDADRTAAGLRVLYAHNFEPKALRPVYAREGDEASLVLISAVKNARPGLRFQAPLILYESERNRNVHTEQALEFCPFLRPKDQTFHTR